MSDRGVDWARLREAAGAVLEMAVFGHALEHATRLAIWDYCIVKTAICDPAAFYPLRDLVSGPFTEIEDLQHVERFIRTVLLHDEVVMELEPLPLSIGAQLRGASVLHFRPLPVNGTHSPPSSQGSAAAIEVGETAALDAQHVMTAIGPTLRGYDFFTERSGPQPVPTIDLSPSLLQLAKQRVDGDEGVYFETHVEFMKRVLATVEHGGSALLCGEFGQAVVNTAQRYPSELFSQLDKDWQECARQLDEDGIGLSVPPVLGIVLTRCARREAIPAVILDLRNEWAGARKKVWHLIDGLRTARSVGEALEIQKGIADASRLFSPKTTDLDTRPARVFWEILAADLAGGLTRSIGGTPLMGAATAAIVYGARSLPGVLQDFGAAVFGRGAFDLAGKLRRGVSEVDFNALSKLLTDAEKQKLGLR